MTGVCLAVSGLRWSTLIKLGRLVRVVQGAFPKVSVAVEERFVLVERAAFLIVVRASCYRQSAYQGSKSDPC